MKSLNQVTIMGNLTRDPELRTTPQGQSVTNFSVALNSSYKGNDGELKEKVDFIDVQAWGATAEVVDKWLSKGRAVLVHGRLQTRQWEHNGLKKQKTEVVAQDVIFVDGKGE